MMKPTFALVVALLLTTSVSGAEPWKRHVIDDTYRGADGVRLGDFDGDGLMDVTTGWEESGIVRLYLNPGPEQCDQPWPAVTLATAASPEDAVPVDLDGDGLLDVVSCHEGNADSCSSTGITAIRATGSPSSIRRPGRRCR